MPPDSGSILLLGAIGELHELEQLLGAAPALGARQVEVAAVEHEVVEHGELLVELVLLRHDADPGPDLLAVAGRVHPEDPQLALGDRRDAADHAHRRRLAGAVRPEEAERLAAVDLDVDPVDGGEVAEPLDQAAGRDQRLASLRRWVDSVSLSCIRACPPSSGSRSTAPCDATRCSQPRGFRAYGRCRGTFGRARTLRPLRDQAACTAVRHLGPTPVRHGRRSAHCPARAGVDAQNAVAFALALSAIDPQLGHRDARGGRWPARAVRAGPVRQPRDRDRYRRAAARRRHRVDRRSQRGRRRARRRRGHAGDASPTRSRNSHEHGFVHDADERRHRARPLARRPARRTRTATGSRSCPSANARSPSGRTCRRSAGATPPSRARRAADAFAAAASRRRR